ncbi:arylsulfatase [Colwelliaceae bacterium BS250]
MFCDINLSRRKTNNSPLFKASWLVIISIILSCNLNAADVARGEAKLSQPNIIYILADDMGYSDMSSRGSKIQTPNLDRLAEKGMVLQRNYTQPQCTPTRVSFLTGNYPYRYGLHEHIVLDSSQTGIPAQEKTIAEKMKEGGYKTAIIGKWHVGANKQSYLPHNMGFDHSLIAISGAIDYWNYTSGGRNDLIRNGEKVYAPSKLSKEASGNTYSTFMWAEEAIEVIDSHDQKQPLFMFLSFNSPHSPFHAPKAIMDKYSPDEIESYWSGADADKGRTTNTRHHYMAMVDAMDKAIGDVVGAVKSNGMAENTLIVFMSDNGGIPQADNRPLRSYKGDSFEGGIRVPGIVYWPGSIKAGAKSSELIHVSDWYATFADLAGMSTKEEGLDGVSARGILEGGKGKRKVVPIISAARHALVTADYSLVGKGENYQRLVNQDLASFRLYDIKQDQSQKKPTRAHPELEKKMEAQLAQHFTKVNRGNFNWDITYAKHRREKKKAHSFDYVIDDLPQLWVSGSGKESTVTISPVSNKLVYNLQGSTDGETWVDLAEHVAKENAKSYVFDGITTNKAFKEFRVLTSDHFGLPLRDGFSFDKGYKKGPLYTETGSGKLLTTLPLIDGFLPISDVSGGEQVMVVADSLTYQNWPKEGGALLLKSKNMDNPPSLTRYFIEPHSQGKIYASMLVQFDGFESECIGEINFLVQNGWNGATEKQLSLSFQNDGITVNQADPIEKNLDSWLGEHQKKTVLLLLEFDLKTIGQDILKVYINPKGKENLIPVAIRKGELTFDRLQFAMTGRSGGKMTVDEVHIGRNIDDVLY